MTGVVIKPGRLGWRGFSATVICVFCKKEVLPEELSLDEREAMSNKKIPDGRRKDSGYPRYSFHEACDNLTWVEGINSPDSCEDNNDWNAYYKLGSALHMGGYRDKVNGR